MFSSNSVNMSSIHSSSYLDFQSKALIISLEQQIVDLKKNIKDVTIECTGEMLRANALQEEIQSYKDKINDFQPNITLLNNKIDDLNHDNFLKDFQNSKLLKEIEVLNTELRTYEHDQNKNLQTENDFLKSKVSDLTEKLSILEHECRNHKVTLNERNALSDKNKALENKCLQCQSNEIVLKKKISDLEIKLQIQSKFFEDEKLKFLDTIESLEEASDSLQKENHGLKTSHDALTQKLDKRSQPKACLNDQIEKKFAEIENKLVSLKLKKLDQKVESSYSSKSSTPFSKRVSQFTNYSLQKDKKYSKKPQSPGTFTSPISLSSSNNSSHISNAYNQRANRVWKHKQPSVSQNSTHAKSFTYSFSKLFELAPRSVRHGVHKVNDFVRNAPKVLKSPLIPRKFFRNETPRFISRWNSTSLNQIDTTYKWFSKVSHTVGPVLKWVPKGVLK